MFAIAKGKQQNQVRQLQCQEQLIDHIPFTFRDCRVHIFSDNLSRNSCMYVSWWPKDCPEFLRKFCISVWDQDSRT